MPIAVLTVAKLVVLGLLYLFLFQAVRTVAADLRGAGDTRTKPPPRPAVANVDRSRKRNRRDPTELVVHAPDSKPRVVALRDQDLTIGRAAQVNVRVDDVYVSDEHAEVARDDDGWVVRDRGSTNGTFLNGAKVTQPTPIGPGDQIRIGKTRLEVRR